jgi:hypothetical protein
MEDKEVDQVAAEVSKLDRQSKYFEEFREAMWALYVEAIEEQKDNKIVSYWVKHNYGYSADYEFDLR